MSTILSLPQYVNKFLPKRSQRKSDGGCVFSQRSLLSDYVVEVIWLVWCVYTSPHLVLLGSWHKPSAASGLSFFTWTAWGHFTWSTISYYWPHRTGHANNSFVNLVNTLRPRQNGRHFADDILKCIFLNENVWISIEISLKFVPKGPINNITALVQIMAWHRPGDKPISEPMMVRLPTHICVTQPQWVKVCFIHWVLNHITLSSWYPGNLYAKIIQISNTYE